jgi:hypothetical protein
MGPFLNFPFPRLNPNRLTIILWGIAQIGHQSCYKNCHVHYKCNTPIPWIILIYLGIHDTLP